MNQREPKKKEGLRVARAIELVGRFPNCRILVVGDVMIDRYVIGKVERLNPEAPVPILHAKSHHCATGGAGNTAKNAAALGASAILVSVVGTDRTAEELAAAATEEGYRAVLVKDPSRPTVEKTRFIVGGQQMLRVDHEETLDIDGVVEEQVVAAIHEAAKVSDAVIVSDYAKGVLTAAVAQAVLAAAAAHKLPVMADVKPSHINRFKGATYISPNRKEAHEYLGLNQHLQGGCSREELAARLHSTFDANVFLTLSEDGMYVFGRDTAGVHVPQIHRVEVADTSGCGDTAAVAIVLAKLCGASDVEAAQVGNAAGAVIAGKIGAVALSQEELLEALMHA
jgi:rfaE bifunctional protein kinase chain/domain